MGHVSARRATGDRRTAGIPRSITPPDSSARFQASLDQLDVILNDWIMNRAFPPQPGGGDPGVDALLEPSRGLVTIEKAAVYFVPRHNPAGLAAAAVFAEHRPQGPPTTGRLAVRKRVTDPATLRGNPRVHVRRRRRRGTASSAATNSAGRGICPRR
jgi:hypothetical protein